MNLFVCVCFNAYFHSLNPMQTLRTLPSFSSTPCDWHWSGPEPLELGQKEREQEEGNERLRDLDDRGTDVNGQVGISMDGESVVTALMRSIDPTGRAETGQGRRETLNVSTTSQTTASEWRFVYIPCIHTHTHTISADHLHFQQLSAQ